jgi:hypothetical protein
MRDSSKAGNRFLNEADIPLESVLLFMAGMMLIITGALLFPISSGRLEFYENGLYGLLLVIFALQIITMGKTPFGDMRRSIPLLAAGVVIAIVGIATCFVTDLHTRLPRILLFIFFGPGGLLLLLQMLLAKDKYRTWKKYGGVFRQLILGCSLVYVLSMVIAVLIWKNNLFTAELSAVVVLVFGASIIYLAGVIWKIYGTYVDKKKPSGGRFDISTDNALILMTGIYMLVLGALLIPVNLGLLPFSGSAQLGLLMVLFAIQMLALGSTPLGQFPRSWLMIVLGLLVASLGIVSCIVPEVLVSLLTVLVGVLNILGGMTSIAKITIPMIRQSGQSRKPQPPILKRLAVAQLTMSLLTILFGISMLISNLIPGLILGVILAANGCVLTYMFYLLVVLGNLEKGEVDHVSVQ